MRLRHKEAMKKLLTKLNRKKQPEEPKGRITTDTLAEHREKVLAGGRKFKYPMQYARHKLVINAIIIGVAAVILLIVLGWYLLYPAQNTSEFMYRVTKVIPVPVASVDGQPVRYSDYLMKYRSAEHYLVEKEQIDIKSEDGQRQLEFIKSESMDDAVADAYALKIAKQQGITVTDAEIESYLTTQREQSGQSEATYNTVIEDYYGWSPEEYREVIKQKLLRQKVAYAVDAPAKDASETITAKIEGGQTDLKAIADTLNATEAGSVTYWAPVWVPRDNRDGGLAEAAGKLQKGQISSAIKTTSNNGYYFVKLLDSNDTSVQYEYLYVPLAQFDQTIETLQEDNKVVRYISIESISTQQQ